MSETDEESAMSLSKPNDQNETLLYKKTSIKIKDGSLKSQQSSMFDLLGTGKQKAN